MGLTLYTMSTTNHLMSTVVQSCRLQPVDAALLARQAKQRHLDVSTLGSLYLREKALEEEYPGIGFRDSIGGREAYVLGHRVAVWEVLDASRQCGSVSNTADHFQWPPSLVRSALAFAEAFLPEIEKQRFAEIGA